MRSKYILFVFLAMALFFSQKDISFAQNRALPRFKLKNLDGKLVTSAALKGKTVLINFWATWCGPCRHEIPDLVRIQKKYKGPDFSVISIAVSSGNPKDIRKFARNMKINYPVLLANPAVVRAFGNIKVVPTSFIIDKNGTVQKKLIGAKSYKEFERNILHFIKK